MDDILEINVDDDLLNEFPNHDDFNVNHEVSAQAAAVGPPPPTKCRDHVASVELPSHLTKKTRRPVSASFSKNQKIGHMMTTKEKELDEPTSYGNTIYNKYLDNHILKKIGNKVLEVHRKRPVAHELIENYNSRQVLQDAVDTLQKNVAALESKVDKKEIKDLKAKLSVQNSIQPLQEILCNEHPIEKMDSFTKNIGQRYRDMLKEQATHHKKTV